MKHRPMEKAFVKPQLFCAAACDVFIHLCAQIKNQKDI